MLVGSALNVRYGSEADSACLARSWPIEMDDHPASAGFLLVARACFPARDNPLSSAAGVTLLLPVYLGRDL